jgi:hypothetical protein
MMKNLNLNPAQFKLEVYGVTFNINNQTPYFITSNLQDGNEQDYGEEKFQGACDAIESLILEHTKAGVDVQSKAYKEGLAATLEAIMNNLL